MIAVSTSRAAALAAAGESNNPFVAWDNLGAAATLGGSSVIAGGDRANAVTGSSYDRWRPATGGTTRVLTFDFGTATTISFAAIAAHNLGTLGAAAAIESSADGTTWADAGAGEISPTDNSVLMWRMVTSGAARRYWRLYISDLGTSDEVSVGVVFLGNELIFPRRFYQGFSPVLTPTEVQLQSNVSVGNELLGSSVIGSGSVLSAAINNVLPTFFRGTSWLAFQRHFNEGGGAFFAWRPTKYPEDSHYIWRNGNVLRPENSGPRDLMSVNIEARVYNAQA